MSGLLHVHSMYSINDSTQTPEEIVTRAKQMGFTSVTLTDHGTLMGIEPFIKAGDKHNFNVVPGVETYTKNRNHLILIARNYKGYQDICYAMREANENIEEIKVGAKSLTYPIMTDSILKKYFEGNNDVIATTACIKGYVCDILLINHKIKKHNQKYIDLCADNKNDYDAYNDAVINKKQLKDRIRVLKKELKELNKYTTQEHYDKRKKLEDIISTVPHEQKRYINAVNKLSLFDQMERKASEECPDLISKIKSSEYELQQCEEIINEKKKNHNAYERAFQKTSEITYIDESVLYRDAKENLMFLKSVFSNLYIELQYHGMEEEAYVMPLMAQLGKECEVDFILSNDAHVNADSDELFEARRIVRYNYFDKAQSIMPYERELYIKTNEQVAESLKEIIEDQSVIQKALNNTDIIDECKVIFPNEQHHPEVNTKLSFDEIINEEKERRIRNGEWDDIHEQRMNHEIEVIKSMGFVDYFMVVRDFCIEGRKLGIIPKEYIDYVPYYDFEKVDAWIKEHNFKLGIGIGPGRGSAVGSIVCNMMGITNIDPIKYDLLFERFLNPERVSMPDIDSDIASAIRPLIIRYLKWKYGERAVCSIGTELTYGARNAIAAAGRDRASQLYGESKEGKEKQKEYRYKYTLKISDVIPEDPKIKLCDCDEVFKANNFVESAADKEYSLIIERAKLIEGRVSGVGCHAGGVVISDNDNINEYLPLAWNQKKAVWYAQCNKDRVEEKGLLKMDILGLNTLDCISECLQMIYKYENIRVDIDNIPFEDEVFSNIYAKGLTNSVFQFESDGMKKMLTEFRPNSFEDIILLVACYRPGPLQYLGDIIDIKNGRKKLTYKTPELESILSTTYGATVYQEQVMQIFQKLAGYSLGGADLVRRAMSKKNMDKLEKERQSFVYGDPSRNIDGCVNRGIDKEIANTLFDEMTEFANYAFNKSHAAAYAMVSYQTAWLKYHYPQYFLCSLFNNIDQEKYKVIIEDCDNLGVKLLPLDINHSYYDFVIENNSIRFGFRGIKGIGEVNRGDIEQMCYYRKQHAYTDIKNFLKRNIMTSDTKKGIKYSVIRDTLFTALIDSGCFDTFHQNRECIKKYLGIEAESRTKLIDRINDIVISEDIKDIRYNVKHELELLSAVISERPLDEYEEDNVYGCTPIDQINENGIYHIFGLVIDSVAQKSKKGNDILILKIKGKRGECTAIAMNQIYNAYKDGSLSFKVVKMKISASIKNGNKGIFVNEIYPLVNYSHEYYIDLDSEEKTNNFSKIINNDDSKERDKRIRIEVLCRYVGNDELKKADKPRLVNRYISDEAFELLKNQNMLV